MTLEAVSKLNSRGWCLRPCDIPNELKRRGVQPEAVLKHARTLVWRRDAVEGVLAQGSLAGATSDSTTSRSHNAPVP
jgi:hypothetical protein